eukprot:767634-Hanusia_phi.AAC.4
MHLLYDEATNRGVVVRCLGVPLSGRHDSWGRGAFTGGGVRGWGARGRGSLGLPTSVTCLKGADDGRHSSG